MPTYTRNFGIDKILEEMKEKKAKEAKEKAKEKQAQQAQQAATPSKTPPQKIRSHRERVKEAIQHCKEEGIDISIFDREAFVEFYLILDLKAVTADQYNRIAAKPRTTKEGRFLKQRQLENFKYLYCMLAKIVEVLDGKLIEGAYSEVWRAIPEHQLMRAGKNINKHIDVLNEMIKTVLKDLSNEAFENAQKMVEDAEFMENLQIQDETRRQLNPSAEDYDEELGEEEVIPPIVDVLPVEEDAAVRPTKNHPNLN